MLPPFISEESIHRFKFWMNGRIEQGMRKDGQLYRCVTVLPADQQESVYKLGIALAQYHKPIAITSSDAEYIVWEALRSPEHASANPAIRYAGISSPTLTTNPSHPATGKLYRLGATNHPRAKDYQGQECQIVEVWQRSGSRPLVSVQFADGVQVRGIFFCELEDTEGRQASWQDFRSQMIFSPHRG